MRTAVIAGASGLVGKELLEIVLSSDRYSRIIALTRRRLEVTHPRLQNVITDFHNLSEALVDIHPDDVFCCLGTTMAKAGSKEKFYEVDFTYPMRLAETTLRLGAHQFLLVSALGADKNSAIYYNRVKGEIEEAVTAVGFETTHIFRPSLLLGQRTEKRPGEDAAKVLYKIFSFIIPEKYKAIEAGTVAHAMLRHASDHQTGRFVHESREMQKQQPVTNRNSS